MTISKTGLMTLADLARQVHRPLWQLRRQYDAGLLGVEQLRLGQVRVVRVEDVPVVKRRLREMIRD